MTTTTEIDLDSITTGQAKQALDRVIEQIAQQDSEILVSVDDIKVIAYALENNLQLRDYLMGLTTDGLSVESASNILRVIVELFNSAELPDYPVKTILASYMYRLGDSNALTMLKSGLDRDYSLAKLLNRVMSAGLPDSLFATMSEELHPKVVAELQATSDELANELLRANV